MSLQIFSPAKINLGLSVMGRRIDGYHELHTLFATLDVGDNLWLEAVPQGIEVEVQGALLPLGPENLVYRAAQHYLQALDEPGGVLIRLEKNLPIAAGLGGGSSNAAAVLRGLSVLYPAEFHLPTMALRLGADVPFFLQGGFAEGRGVGERLSALPPIEFHVVLFNPGIPVSAADAYRNLQPSEYTLEQPVMQILEALQNRETPEYWNTLEGPVFRLRPELIEVKQALRQAGLRGVLMSGSGSTFFGLAASANHALFVAKQLQSRHPDAWVRAAKSLV